MTILVPMSQEEFIAFAAEAVPAYAADKVAAGQWNQAEALDFARKSFEKLLPQGLQTVNHHLFTLYDQTNQTDVGVLWIEVQKRAGKQVAFINDISIKPEFQRKGHAKHALAALENLVGSLGLSGISLHVFGHNKSAQALYDSLGYRPTNILMFKPIEDTSA